MRRTVAVRGARPADTLLRAAVVLASLWGVVATVPAALAVPLSPGLIAAGLPAVTGTMAEEDPVDLTAEPEAVAGAGDLPGVQADFVAGDVARDVLAATQGLPIAGGAFFADPAGAGFAIVDEPGGPPFWTTYQRLGGTPSLGAPVSRPFVLPDGRVYQATEYALLVWRPGAPSGELANAMDLLAAAGIDPWLASRGIPARTLAPPAPPWPDALAALAAADEHLAAIANPAIRAAFFGGGEETIGATIGGLTRYGFPTSPAVVTGNRIVQRFQRGALWAPLSPADPAEGGIAQPVGVGSLLRDSGLLTEAALAPDWVVGGRLVSRAGRPQLAWRNDAGWNVPGSQAPALSLPVASPVSAAAPAAAPGASPAETDWQPGSAAATPPASATAGASPTPSRATATPAATGVPTARPSPTGPARATVTALPAAPLRPGAAPVVRAVVNDGRAERVMIANQGTVPQELTGWVLRSATGGQTYSFPAGFVLAASATVTVHSGAGDPATLHRPPGDLYATRSNIWNNAADRAQLVAPGGQIISEYRYGMP